MEWLKKILEGIDSADELVSKICVELPKNFIPKDKYNQLLEEKKQLLSQQKNVSSAAVKKAVIKFALSSLSKKAEVKDPEIIKMLIDNEAVSVNDDGEVSGLSEQIEALKSQKPYLFADELLNGRTPILGSSAPMGISKEQFSKMGYKERLELYNNNPELYSKLSE